MTKPARKKVGRPRKLTPELELILLREISEGKTIEDACNIVGISRQSMAVRRSEDDGFRDRLARAYLHGTVFSLDDAEHRLRHSNPKRIAIDREVAHHARWRASRLLPAFSDRLRVTPDVPPVLIKPWAEMTDMECIEMARGLRFILSSGDQAAENLKAKTQPAAPLQLTYMPTAPTSEPEGEAPTPGDGSGHLETAEERELRLQAARDEREYAREISAGIRQTNTLQQSAFQSRGPRRWKR